MAGAPGCGLWGGNYEGVGGAGGDSPRPALPGPADRGRGAHGGEGAQAAILCVAAHLISVHGIAAALLQLRENLAAWMS